MNAYLMSAGLATRLRPVTESFPKCLLPVKGIPILEVWLIACLRSKSFDNIFVNVHHCSEIVFSWIKGFSERFCKIYGKKAIDSIVTIDESSKLLGTAGTLFWHGDNTSDFFLAYTDTYSGEVFNILPELAGRWTGNPDNALAGLITFPVPKDFSAGTMEIDQLRVIRNFKEKGGSGLAAWAGMMFARKDFISHIRREDFDLARDVFPRLDGKMIAFEHVQAYDIGRGVEEYENIRS